MTKKHAKLPSMQRVHLKVAVTTAGDMLNKMMMMVTGIF